MQFFLLYILNYPLTRIKKRAQKISISFDAMENYKAIENDSEIIFINKTWKKSNVIVSKALPNFFPINDVIIYRTYYK